MKNGLYVIYLIIILLIAYIFINFVDLTPKIDEDIAYDFENYAKKIVRVMKNKNYVSDISLVDNEWLGDNINSSISCKNIYYYNNEIVLDECKYQRKTYYYYNKLYTKKNKTIENKINEMINATNKIVEVKRLNEIVTIDLNLKIDKIDECVKNGNCKFGTPLAIAVSPQETYKFYVISDDNEKLDLIMDHNLIDNVSWADSDNLEGPMKLKEIIRNTTSSWINITQRFYDIKYKKNKNLKIKERATLLDTKIFNENEIFKENLNKSNGYWTNLADENKSFNAYAVTKNNLKSIDITLSNYGFRPVITIYR